MPASAVMLRGHHERTMTDDNDKPPIARSWRALYTAVLIALAAEVVLFYVFTRGFE